MPKKPIVVSSVFAFLLTAVFLTFIDATPKQTLFALFALTAVCLFVWGLSVTNGNK